MWTDNFDTLYFNGCSFTEGGGLEERTENVKQAYKEKYNIIYKSEKDVSYPSLIQKKLPNLKIINEAKSGSGSERIVRKAYEFITKNGLKKSQKTIFFFEIQRAINRLDVYSNKYNKYLVANVDYNQNGKINDTQTTLNWIYGPQMDEEYRNKTRELIKEYSEYFIHPLKYEENVCYSFLGLISFLQKNNITFFVSGGLHYFTNHINFNNYFPNFLDNHLLKIDYNNKTYDDITSLANNNKMQICDDVGVEISKDGHPGIFAHQIWADGIINFLNKKYL